MEIFPDFSFSSRLLEAAARCEERLADRFTQVEATARYNSQKVHAAFIGAKVSETHFITTTGYGYGDRGRDVIDEVYARIFKAEAALVRHFMLSGTHALTTALFGILRPGDTMLSVAGKPYDTLDKVIGFTGASGSLMDFGIKYSEVPLSDGRLDYFAIEEALASKPKMAYLQRSRGYAPRPSIFISEIEKVAQIVRKISPDTIFMVDNCYGEFVERKEPIEVGADLIAGSLIKNPGGGIADSGGYIAGRADLVTMCAGRLTSPGLGREVGASIGQNRPILQGIYYSPEVTANALKTAIFAASLFEELGYDCSPRWCDERTDIVEQILLQTPEKLMAFCQGIQAGSAIDSFVTPEPWDMPGYTSQVVMAAGAFVGGSSIELSADGPLRPPYCAFMQGGTNYDNAIIGVLKAAEGVL